MSSVTSGRFPMFALPLALLGSGCAATARIGPQYRLLPASGSVVGGQGTLGGGLGTADSRFQLTVPVGLSFGGPLKGGKLESSLEIGNEGSFVGESNVGGRIAAVVGVGLSGTRGTYLGLRGGPTLSLAPLAEDDWTPTVTLEGLAGVGVGGRVAGSGVLGVALSFGWDRYGKFRIPSGRPLRDGGGEAWLATAELGRKSSGTPRAVREHVGHAWLEEGLAEYASIASFLRLALELAHLGAPAELIRRARAAADDEVRHARACFAMAKAYLGRAVRPAELPAPAPRPEASLELLANECWHDGCVGEGTAAYVASLRARSAADPAARRTWRLIARDEARHAELGWAILGWCVAEPA